MRWIVSILLSLMLAACGGSDVTVRVNGSPGQVLAPLTLASTGELGALFPGLKVVKTRPSDRELLFTFPGDGKQDPATIHFTVTEGGDKEHTDVTAAVDVPAVSVNLRGKAMTLSGWRVANEIRRTLEGMNQSGRDSATERLSGVLLALAIVTDEQSKTKALAMADSPLSAIREMADGGGDEFAQRDRNDPTEYDAPGEYNDPTRYENQGSSNNDPTEYDRPDSYGEE